MSAEGVCRSLLPTSAELGPGAERRERFHDPRKSYGFWRTVIAVRSGADTMMLFESAERRATQNCFVGRKPASAAMGGSYAYGPPAWPPAKVAAHAVSGPMSGGGTTLRAEGSEQYSWIAARVGADVRGVTIRFLDGGHVSARIAGGWYLAWWPGRRPLAKADAVVTS